MALLYTAIEQVRFSFLYGASDMSFDIPSCAWKLSLSDAPTRPGRPRSYPMDLEPSMVWPNLHEIPVDLDQQFYEMLPCPPTRPIDDGYNQGVPIGGLGAGSIGRSYRGDFARWHLRAGTHEYEPSLPDQFHLRVERQRQISVHTLNPAVPEGNRLSSWAWGLKPGRATYHALFPRAWTTYNFSDLGIEAVCQQISPVIGHNYRESSYPVGVFAWRIRNLKTEPVVASLMLTWENSVSPMQPPLPGLHECSHDPPHNRLLLVMQQGRTSEDDAVPVSFGLGLEAPDGAELSCVTRFDTQTRGNEIWRNFRRTGILTETEPKPTRAAHSEGAALCMKVSLGAEETAESAFAVSWDIPVVQFGRGRRWYKHYTRFFGTKGDSAAPIARNALDSWRDWARMISDWQKPVLESDRPDWLKAGLFNELYFLVDSSSCWVASEVGHNAPSEGLGHFGYLECFEYPFINTYDVLFYASFAMLMNWPELDNSIQRDFADAIDIDDQKLRTILLGRKSVPRKPGGVVPHDLGTPLEDPWYETNAYAYLDSTKWKDLSSKFALQVYRNHLFTQDDAFLKHCWPAVKRTMEYLDSFDRDDDGLPENEGFPDQTYDNWRMQGPSAYCGGLYLAAVEAMAAMAQNTKDRQVEKKYRLILERGRKSFTEKLWNGRYYNFDASSAKHHDSIMADQLAGQWYAHVCGLPRIVPQENSGSALQTIYDFNVQRFQLGRMGAVNGMRPDGTPDETCPQSAEVWTGVTYGLAALMLHEGLVEQGFKTALGVYDVTYKDRGYWFRTPEAWTDLGSFRASMHMRALAIWAIEYALSSGSSGSARANRNIPPR